MRPARLALLWGAIALLPPPSAEAARRAVLVGVAEYGRRDVPPLRGPANDARALAQVLGAVCGFDNVVLIDKAATRDAILLAAGNLFGNAAPADEVLFFFSGQALAGKLLPWDYAREGDEISAQELEALVHRAPPGVLPTVILDVDYGASFKPSNVEADQLFLFASAADRPAFELTAGKEGSFGVFSRGIVEALRESSRETDVGVLFERVKLFTRIERQVPFLFAGANRANRPLFSAPAAAGGRSLRIPVLAAEGTRVKLAAGSGLGLEENWELTVRNTGPTPTRLRVTEVLGVNESWARVIRGSLPATAPGQRLELDLDLWVPSPANPLRVYRPEKLPSAADLRRHQAALLQLRSSKAVGWVEDPLVTPPTHVVTWENQWVMRDVASADVWVPLGPVTSAAAIEKLVLSSRPRARKRVFIAFPPPAEIFDALRIGGNVNTAIASTPKLADADYTLRGRLSGDQIEYAWHIQPPPTTDRLVTPLPARTEWIGGGATAEMARRLEDAILRVVRIRGWFQLESPPDEGRFPFRLGLKDAKTGKVNTDGFTAQFGDSFNVVLVGSPKATGAIEPRYVYVLIIDSFGNSSLMYPSRSSLATDPPARIESLEPAIRLGVTIEVAPPAGVDTWVLLTSSEPLSDPQILSFQGRNTRGVRAESTLARLLIAVGSPDRVQYPATPTNWSIQKLLVRSGPGGGAMAE